MRSHRTSVCLSEPAPTHIKDRANHHPMPLLQTSSIPLREAHTQLLIFVRQVDSETKSGEIESSDQPQETDGRGTVFGVWVGGLVMCEEGFEGGGGSGVGGEVPADFLETGEDGQYSTKDE